MCACAVPRTALAQASASGSSASGSSDIGSKTDGTKPPTANPNAHAAAQNSKSKRVGSRKNSKRKTTARGQQKIDPERAQAIQEALIREHYLSGAAAGTWNQSSEEAMRRYQADHGWQSKTVPDSRALISLGLGPSHDRLLNPESAMTTGPAGPRAATLTPVSHSADPGARMNMNPAPPAEPPPAAAPEHDSSGPQ
jgi:hypothetical protein